MDFTTFESFFHVFYVQIVFAAQIFMLVSAMFLAVMTVIAALNRK